MDHSLWGPQAMTCSALNSFSHDPKVPQLQWPINLTPTTFLYLFQSAQILAVGCDRPNRIGEIVLGTKAAIISYRMKLKIW